MLNQSKKSIKNGLKQILATALVHIEDALGDNILDLLLRHMVHQSPIVLVHGAVLSQSLVRVFGNVGLSLLRMQVVKQLRIFVFKLRNGLDISVSKTLGARKLLNHSLHFPAVVALMDSVFGSENFQLVLSFAILPFLA